jgi:hypothetical protein
LPRLLFILSELRLGNLHSSAKRKNERKDPFQSGRQQAKIFQVLQKHSIEKLSDSSDREVVNKVPDITAG